MNLIDIGPVVKEINEVENVQLKVSVNNTFVPHMIF